MDKVFEALKRIETVFSLNKEGKPNVYKEYSNSVEPFYNDFNLVLNALLELQAIKEAKPSEAMECLKSLDIQVRFLGILDIPSWEKYLPTIKATLLKTEKLEKAWEIVKEKNVDVALIRLCKDSGEYNGEITLQDEWWHRKLLTEEEFELIKEMLG